MNESSQPLTPLALLARRDRPGMGSLQEKRTALPRKEVIQPHLPVRLPCYDFTPVTNPTLDSCFQA